LVFLFAFAWLHFVAKAADITECNSIEPLPRVDSVESSGFKMDGIGGERGQVLGLLTNIVVELALFLLESKKFFLLCSYCGQLL
jgi:hypothetical protein